MEDSAEAFFDELKESGLLQNSDLERAIRAQTNPSTIVNGGLKVILRHALREMNSREIGVYTAAAIIISAINSTKS